MQRSEFETRSGLSHYYISSLQKKKRKTARMTYFNQFVAITFNYQSFILKCKLGCIHSMLFWISINLVVVYRESVNLIGYLTRRLSADSLQLWIANESQLFWTCDACFTPQCTHHAQCLKPLNCRCKHIKTFFPKRYVTFLCNETTSKFILKQLDYSPSFSTSDSQLGCASLTIRS